MNPNRYVVEWRREHDALGPGETYAVISDCPICGTTWTQRICYGPVFHGSSLFDALQRHLRTMQVHIATKHPKEYVT